MKMLHSARNTTWLARAMLFVWLFGLAVSWANACVLQQGQPPAPEPDAATHADGDAAHTHPEPAAGSRACQDFCDTEQSVVVKPRVSEPIDLGPVSLAMPEPWAAWPLHAAPAAWRPLAAPPPPGPPAAIRFLRLTI